MFDIDNITKSYLEHGERSDHIQQANINDFGGIPGINLFFLTLYRNEFINRLRVCSA